MPPLARSRENLWLNIGCNVAAPALILTKLSDQLGAKTALVVALAFPLGYGAYDLARRRNFNFLSALGFVSTLATGGLGLLKLDPHWFAIKEAIVPTLIGLAVIVSQWTHRPLVRSLLFNDQVIDVPKVEQRLAERGEQNAFSRHLAQGSWLLAGSFFVSAILNFTLAKMIIRHMPDTPEFNSELGRMTWLSWPVIVLPTMAIMMAALWRLLRAVERLTGLTFEEILHHHEKKERAGGQDL